MSSLTSNFPQLYEDELALTKILRSRIRSLEHDLDVTKRDLEATKRALNKSEDQLEYQTERLSNRDAALLDLQTAFNRASREHDEELRMLRKELESPKLSTGDDRRAGMVKGSKPPNTPVNTLKVLPLTQSVQSVGKPNTLPQRREMPIRPATKRDTLEATKTPARNQPVNDDGLTEPLKVRSAPAIKDLSQESPFLEADWIKPYTPVASTEKRAPKAMPQIQNATEGIPLPGSLQTVDQDARKRRHARSSRSSAIAQASPPASAPAPTSAPSHQNKVQDEGSQLKPGLPTNTKAPKQSTSSLDSGVIAFTPAGTKSMAQVAAEPPQQMSSYCRNSFASLAEKPPVIKKPMAQVADGFPKREHAAWEYWDRVIAESFQVAPEIRSKTPDQKKMKDATAGKVVEPGKPKPEPESEPEQEQTSEDSQLAEIPAKELEEEGWVPPTDPSTMRSASKVDARKPRKPRKRKSRRSAAKSKAKLTPTEREMLRLENRQSLHIS